MSQEDEAAEIGALLSELALREPVPPLAYQSVVRGGRRRRARRRVALASTAAVTVVAVAAGVVAALPDSGGRAAGPATTGPPPTAAPTTAAPTTTATHPAAAVNDPMTPTPRAVLARGTDDQGRHWEVRVRLWHAPKTRAQAFQQYLAVWQDEGAEPGTRPVMAEVPEYYRTDHVQTSVFIDGQRVPPAYSFYDADLPGTALGHLNSVPAFAYEEGRLPWDGVSAECAGWTKSERYPAVAGTGTVRPDIAKVTVHWSDGRTESPPLRRVDPSPDRFFAFTCHPGAKAVISGYGKDGTELLRSADAVRTW